MTDPTLPNEAPVPPEATVAMESAPNEPAAAPNPPSGALRTGRGGATAGRGRSLVAWILALVLVAGVAAWFALAAPKGPSSTYVTATASNGDVTQSFNVSGTVSRTNQVAAAFGASGLVNAVMVHIGDSVNAGQTLATLDPISLNQAVLQAKAQLAQALATLDSAENPVPSASAISATAATASATVAASGPTLQQAQAALQAALATATKDLAAAQSAATAEATACAPVFAYLAPTASPSASSTPTTSSSATASATATATTTATASASATTSTSTTASPSTSTSTPTTAQIVACQTALAAVTKAQSVAGTALQAVSAAQLEVSKASAAATSSGSGMVSAATAAAAATPTVDAAKVAQAEAQVLSARQAVATAQANVEAGTLTAPVAGRVAAVSMTTGQSSSTSSVTLIGSGSAQIAVEIPLATRPMITVGMNVVVNAAGSTKTLAGQVATINALETSGTTGAPTYTTTIVVDDPDLLLAPGSKADASIPVKTASNVLTVPVSAVTPVTSTTGTVKVLKAGATAAESVTVTLGAVGGGKVEISSGLTAGAIVVLADRSASIPANANAQRPGTTSTTGSSSSARASSSASAAQPTPTR